MPGNREKKRDTARCKKKEGGVKGEERDICLYFLHQRMRAKRRRKERRKEREGAEE